MPESDRPLPAPPRSRFDHDSQEEPGSAPGLLSDRMALAAAAGRLEDFLQHEIPEGEHARKLALMMMGMSGMMPQEMPAGLPQAGTPPGPAPVAPEAQTAAAPEVPPEVLAAIQQGDVANLMGILHTEHAKRAAPGAVVDEAMQATISPSAEPSAADRAGIDAAIIDELIRISTDNDVTVDWLMLRAVKLYVEEYRKTGRL